MAMSLQKHNEYTHKLRANTLERVLDEFGGHFHQCHETLRRNAALTFEKAAELGMDMDRFHDTDYVYPATRYANNWDDRPIDPPQYAAYPDPNSDDCRSRLMCPALPEQDVLAYMRMLHTIPATDLRGCIAANAFEYDTEYREFLRNAHQYTAVSLMVAHKMMLSRSVPDVLITSIFEYVFIDASTYVAPLAWTMSYSNDAHDNLRDMAEGLAELGDEKDVDDFAVMTGASRVLDKELVEDDYRRNRQRGAYYDISVSFDGEVEYKEDEGDGLEYEPEDMAALMREDAAADNALNAQLDLVLELNQTLES